MLTPENPVHQNLKSPLVILQGDAFDPASWRSELKGAVGVVSTLGGFGSNDFMYKVTQRS